MKAFSSKRPKEIWRTIHRILNPNPKPIRVNPNELNTFFTTTAERTLGKAAVDKTSDLLTLVNSLPDHRDACTFKLREITQAEVLREIKQIRTDCSTGPDQLPVKLLKPVAEFLAAPLTHIINSCIRSSYFPEAWKIARISLIPKIEQPKAEQDYRPVSILPALSKVFERLVSRQMISFIEDLALFNSSISGFRKGHSTATTLLGIRDDIIRAMRRGEVTLMVLADYSKAFDTVNFRSVITKMHSMGFSKNFLHWILAYLTKRQQFVQIDDKFSEKLETRFGVPQGSILGPLIFNIYVSDLQGKVQCHCYQYADDTTLLQHSRPNELDKCVQEMNQTIQRLNDYSADSNLALNSNKTKWMILSTKQMSATHSLEELPIDINSHKKSLSRVFSTKLLGIHLDQHLSWREHITNLLSSCYATLSVLRKLRNFAPFHVRKRLVESLVLSKLDYCNVMFSSLPDYQLKRLQRVQNTCAGYVLTKFAGIEDLQGLGWLPIKEYEY